MPDILRGLSAPVEVLVNLTPHDVHLLRGSDVVTIRPQGLCRVQVREIVIGNILGVPITKNVYDGCFGLPDFDAAAGVGYIVSSKTARMFPDRADLFVPSHTVRDASGSPIGSQSLSRVYDEPR